MRFEAFISVHSVLSLLSAPLFIVEVTIADPLQSGLATKVEKPGRKLRKERKNRQKKVRITNGIKYV
jgi:hypothetical protein